MIRKLLLWLKIGLTLTIYIFIPAIFFPKGVRASTSKDYQQMGKTLRVVDRRVSPSRQQNVVGSPTASASQPKGLSPTASEFQPKVILLLGIQKKVIDLALILIYLLGIEFIIIRMRAMYVF